MAQTSQPRNPRHAPEPIAAALPLRDELAPYHLMDEVRLVGALVERAVYTADERRRITETARRLVHAVRAGKGRYGGIDAFLGPPGRRLGRARLVPRLTSAAA